MDPLVRVGARHLDACVPPAIHSRARNGTRVPRRIARRRIGNARITGALCYDYSFPEIARDNAADGADLVLVPSSDWRGIDPLHPKMVTLNAVAAGLPIVRPVRAATSVATDAYGRTLGSMRWGTGDGIMVTTVLAGRVPTLYAKTGEVLPLAALAFSALAVAMAVRAGRRRHAEASDPRGA